MRPEILLSGFFGRGNCGDEAILQVQYECLKDDFDCVISVDFHDAYDGFWNWYPYNQCQLVHTSNLAIYRDQRLRVMHVGGGGLPLPFNASQVLSARLARIPVAMTGTDILELTADMAASVANKYLKLFSYLSPRTRISVGRLTKLGVAATLGADWACLLGTDDKGDKLAKGQVLVVLRELPSSSLPHNYFSVVEKLIKEIEFKTGLRVLLLPFCSEDEKFLSPHLNLTKWPVLRHWWNPRRVQRIIADAQLVVSIGRLHPLIMAANTKTEAIYVEPLTQYSCSMQSQKALDMSYELNFQYYSSLYFAFEQMKTQGITANAPVWSVDFTPSQRLESQIKWLYAAADSRR